MSKLIYSKNIDSLIKGIESEFNSDMNLNVETRKKLTKEIVNVHSSLFNELNSLKKSMNISTDEYVKPFDEDKIINIEKSFDQQIEEKRKQIESLRQLDLIKSDEIKEDIDSEELVEKALRDTSHLTLESITDKNGKITRHWVDKDKKKDIEIGSKVAYEHNGRVRGGGTVKFVAKNGQYVINTKEGEKIAKHPHQVKLHESKEPVRMVVETPEDTQDVDFEVVNEEKSNTNKEEKFDLSDDAKKELKKEFPDEYEKYLLTAKNGIVDINDFVKKIVASQATGEEAVKKWVKKISNGERPFIIIEKDRGMLNMLTNKREKNDFFYVMNGHHRLDAYKQLNINDIPVINVGRNGEYDFKESKKNSEEKLIFHGTSKETAKHIRENGFDIAKTADGTVWFTDNKSKVENGEVGASTSGNVIERKINENNLKLGGWDEQDKFSTDELIQMGYDGLKLVSDDETTYQIFYPHKLIDVVEEDLEKGIDKTKNHLESKTDKAGHITKKWVANEKKQPKPKEWWHKFTELKLNKYPVGIPKENVTINMEGDINSHAVMKWIDPKSGKMIHVYTREFLDRNAQEKWKRIAKVDSRIITSILTKVKRNLVEGDDKEKQCSAIIGMIAHTGLRPGGRAAFEKTKNRGISTLSPKNITFKGNKAILNFTGKSYHENNSEFTDSLLVNYLKDRVALAKKNKSDFVFDYDRTEADDMFKNKMGYKGLKLKDMRTYIATSMAKDILFKNFETFKDNLSDKEKTNQKIIAARLRDCYVKVSTKLNNSPMMAKNSYIHPNIKLDFLEKLGVPTDFVKGEDSEMIEGLKGLSEFDKIVAKYPYVKGDVNIDDEDEEECDIFNLLPWELVEDDINFEKGEDDDLEKAKYSDCPECGNAIRNDKCNKCCYGYSPEDYASSYNMEDNLEKALRNTSHLRLVSFIDKNGKKSQHWIDPNKGENALDMESGTKVKYQMKGGEIKIGMVSKVTGKGEYEIRTESGEKIWKMPHLVTHHEIEEINAVQQTTVDINQPIEDSKGEINNTVDTSIQPIKAQRTPSPQQQVIFDFVAKGTGNAALDAKAGTGKTTTIVDALKFIPKEKSIAFVAFSKAIVEELQSRIPEVVHLSTLHSFGFKAIRKVYGNLKLEKDKNKIVLNDFLMSKALTKYPTDDLEGERIAWLSNVYRLISIGKQNLTDDTVELDKEADKLGMTLLGDESTYVKTCLEKLLEKKDMIDFDDMIYLPAKYSKLPVDRYDFVFVDECQDLNKMQLALVKRMFDGGKGQRMIAVGDPQQAIFGFAGSDENSFNNIADLPNTVRLPLSVSYRCAKNIIKYVREKTKVDIDFWENSKDGRVNEEASVESIKDGDMVICRNTAPLISLCMMFIGRKKAAYIRGREIGDVLANQIKRYVPKRQIDSPDGFKSLYDKLSKEIDKARGKAKSKGLTDEQANESSGVVILQERMDCFMALQDDSKTPNEMIKNIQKIFSETAKGGIQLTTAHRSKGLESNNVYIVDDFLLHGTRAKNQFQQIQENNLRYVSYTRAKDSLNFITDWTAFPNRDKGDKVKNQDAIHHRLVKSISVIPDLIDDDTLTKSVQEFITEEIEKAISDLPGNWQEVTNKKTGKTFYRRYHVRQKEHDVNSDTDSRPKDFETRKKEFDRASYNNDLFHLKEKLASAFRYNNEYFSTSGEKLQIPERYKDIIDKKYNASNNYRTFMTKYERESFGGNPKHVDLEKEAAKKALPELKRRINIYNSVKKKYDEKYGKDVADNEISKTKKNILKQFEKISSDNSSLSSMLSAAYSLKREILDDLDPTIEITFNYKKQEIALSEFLSRMEKQKADKKDLKQNTGIQKLVIKDFEDFNDEDFKTRNIQEASNTMIDKAVRKIYKELYQRDMSDNLFVGSFDEDKDPTKKENDAEKKSLKKKSAELLKKININIKGATNPIVSKEDKKKFLAEIVSLKKERNEVTEKLKNL